jgi:hypothetical protein
MTLGLLHRETNIPLTRAEVRQRLDQALTEALDAEQREADRAATWGMEAGDQFEQALGL